MHIKKTEMPKTWPIPRKGKRKRFIAVPTHAKYNAITLLYLLRDVLKIAPTRKEVKYVLANKGIKVNNKTRTNEAFPVQVFDTIELEKTSKNYRLELLNKKFVLKEITSKETETKIVKIIGKKILAKNKIQMNLEDGQNFLAKEKFALGDSVIVNTKTNKIEKILPLKEKSEVEIIKGKHAGKKGKIISIKNLAREKAYIVKLEDKDVSLPLKTLLVVK